MVVRTGGVGQLPWRISARANVPGEDHVLTIESAVMAVSRSEAIDLGTSRITRLGYMPIVVTAVVDNSIPPNTLRIEGPWTGQHSKVGDGAAASGMDASGEPKPEPFFDPQFFTKYTNTTRIHYDRGDI